MTRDEIVSELYKNSDKTVKVAIGIIDKIQKSHHEQIKELEKYVMSL